MIAPIILASSGGIADRAKDVALQFGGNWTLFFSQVISFLIVAALLQKFAYRPIIDVLEERRKRIAEGLENADKIKQQLADAEFRHQEILNKANQEAQKMIEEARASAAVLAEKRQQQAITEAEQIIVKAREAIEMEHEKMLADLRREMGRLVVATTAKVTGKILTVDDQKRLADEAVREIAA